MPSSAIAKIKSARSLPFVALALVLVAAAAIWWLTAGSTAEKSLQAGGQTYHLELAATPEARQQGLSGREALAQDRGMLFMYEREGIFCFWMQDMQFALDIMWLDAQQTVVHIEAHVSPETYPASFCPDSGAQYVIELNAGEAARAGIETGQQLDIQPSP